MPYPSFTEEWNDLTSSTTAARLPGVFKQTITDHPTLKELTQNNRIISGQGKQIEFAVSFGENDSVQFITSSAQRVSFHNQAALTKGKVDSALLIGHVLYSEEEKDQNSGDEQQADLIDLKLEQLKDTVDRKMAKAIFSNGTLNGRACTKGLRFWVPTNPGALTIAGLSETDFTWWRSQRRGSAGAWATNGWGGTGANHVLNMIIRTTDGSRRPTLIISDDGVFQEFHNHLLQKLTIPTDGGFKSFGDLGLQIPGTGAKYIWDKDCPAGTMYFLHPRDFFFYTSPNLDGSMLPMMRIPDQPLLQYQFLSWKHQLVNVRRNAQGTVDGWTIPS